MLKNKLYLYIIIVSVLGACNSIDDDERFWNYELPELKRNVLLEEFTGQDCPNCPEGSAEAKRLQEIFDHKVIVIGIHAGGLAKAKYITEAGKTYWTKFYQDGDTRGYPAAMVNRAGKVSTGYQSEWSQWVIKAGLIPASISLSMVVDYNDEDSTLSVTSVLKKSIAEEDNKVKLLLMLTESKIYDYQSHGGAKYEHNHVLRGAIGDKDEVPNYWGDEIEISSLEDTKITAKSYKLDKNWKPEDMNIVGVVYNVNTYEVLQVEEIPVINNNN